MKLTLIAVLTALLASAAVAGESCHPVISVVDEIGLDDQIVRHDIDAVLDLNSCDRLAAEIVGGYRMMELGDQDLDEIDLGVGARLGCTKTALHVGVGLRMREGIDTFSTEQDVVTTTTTDGSTTTTTTTTTPPKKANRGQSKKKKPPTTTTTTTSTSTTTTTVDTIYGEDDVVVDSTMLAYAAGHHRIGDGKMVLELNADGVLLRDGYEWNVIVAPTLRLGAIAVDVNGFYQGREYWTESLVLESIEDEEEGFGVGAGVAIKRNVRVGLNYLLDQDTLTLVAGLRF